jgi:ubiquinone/menaquinone biosynthesis C-methylase UbiE
MAEITPEPIFKVASGFMAAKHLFIANEIGLFDQLAGGPASLDDLARRTDVARARVRIIADAMVSLGFLERDGDAYRNSPVAAAFLCDGTTADMRPFLRFWNHLSYPMWTKLEDAVRTGEAQTTLNLSDDLQRIFSEGVEAIQAVPSQALPAAYDFTRHNRMLDIGGGTGSWLSAVLDRYGDLEGTLFELPSAAAVARRNLSAVGSAERLEVVDGDFFTDTLPEGHDVVLVANVMHLFSPESNQALLRSARQSVPDGARLLLADFWTDETHTDPPFAALMAAEFLMFTGEGDVYSEQEARAWLEETGWQTLEHKPLAGPQSLIVAETAN